MIADARSALAAPVLAGAARVGLGAFWLHEGWFKISAGFGKADILLVADGAASNSRVPGYFAWFADHVLGPAPSFFAVATIATELVLGTLLIAGVLTVPVALASLANLALYWSSDQLAWQYPLMAVLSALVILAPVASSRFALSRWLAPRLAFLPQPLGRWV